MAKKLKKKAAEEMEETTEVSTPSEEVKEETKTEVESKPEEKAEEIITLDSGATVDESAQPTIEEAEDLVKITKEDGTELFVEKVDADSEEEKKEIYEAIVEADTTEDSAEEAADEVLEALDDSEKDTEESDEDEIESVSYIPAACHNVEASLNNSFIVFKLKSGKIKALKAGKIYNNKLKAAMLAKIKANKEEEIPHISTIIKKMASKIGFSFASFKKQASLNKSMIKKAADETSSEKEALKNTSLEQKDITKQNYESTTAMDDKEVEFIDGPKETKPAKSQVSSYYGKLPSKSEVGSEPEWSLKDFNEKRNKTVASQVKSLRESVELVKKLKAEKIELETKNKELQEKLSKIEASQKNALKYNKITKILAAMNCKDELVKRTWQKTLSSYDDSQLDAVLACYSMDPEIETNLMNEREIETMKKEASVDVPPVTLGDDYSFDFNNEVDYVSLLKKEEMNKINN